MINIWQTANLLQTINNERSHKQQQYKENMLSLKQLVLVRFADDVLVVPKDSAWFGYWDGQRLQSMNETQLYQVLWPLSYNCDAVPQQHKPESKASLVLLRHPASGLLSCMCSLQMCC